MDTSETYIKMCEKATEIQRLTPNMQLGSWCDDDGRRRMWIGEKVYTFGEDGFSIWLPRQDQLQGMVRDNLDVEVLLDDFYRFCNPEPEPYGAEDGTIEYRILPKPEGSTFDQLWLAFVMRERYGKDWKGENWIAT